VTTILALGETLWDVFPDGPRFGGAAANFACACAGLGGGRVHTLLASAVGRDELGNEAVRRLTERGVDVSLVAANDRPTGQVFVELDPAGKASYRFLEDAAWDRMTATPELLSAAQSADAIYFGTLGQRSPASRDAIRAAVLASPPDRLRILDINLRSPHWAPETLVESLVLANALKLNDDELPIVAQTIGFAGGEAELLERLRSRYSLRLIGLTRGANGSRMLDSEGVGSEVRSHPVTIADTVGAGDTFCAAMVLGYLHGLPLGRIHEWATGAAAFVCTQPGGTPAFPGRFQLSTQSGKAL
jgi:fructokinase